MVEGPSPVAVGLDELDDGMIGGPGSEACPVVHLVLQRGEERLGHGAAVAVAGTAARQAHGPFGARPLSERPVAYWELLSLWKMAFPATYLCDIADSSAVAAMSVVMRSESNR